MAVGVVALGAFLPPRVIGNDVISSATGMSAAEILRRTGISTRRYSDPDTPTSTLACHAVRDLLRQQPDALDNLGFIIVATSTPDQPQPATATIVQHHLRAQPVPCMDVQAVCSGFPYGLVLGAAYAEQSGLDVLLIGTDKYSGIIDHTDYRTAALFGDGAGAALLRHVPDGYGLLSSTLVTHGEYHDHIKVIAGGSARPLDAQRLEAGEQLFRMEGRKVRDYVLQTAPAIVDSALHKAELRRADVDRWICHQANPRLLGMFAELMQLDPHRLVITGDAWGNAAAASIPMTLWETQRERPFQRGEVLALVSFGGGMTVAAVLVRCY